MDGRTQERVTRWMLSKPENLKLGPFVEKALFRLSKASMAHDPVRWLEEYYKAAKEESGPQFFKLYAAEDQPATDTDFMDDGTIDGSEKFTAVNRFCARNPGAAAASFARTTCEETLAWLKASKSDMTLEEALDAAWRSRSTYATVESRRRASNV